MEIVGKVIQIFPSVSGKSGKGDWQKQDVVFEQIDPSAKYVRKALITFFNRPQDIAVLQVGKIYTVSFDIDAREYNGRWFSDINAWRVVPKDQSQDVIRHTPDEEHMEFTSASDDIPF